MARCVTEAWLNPSANQLQRAVHRREKELPDQDKHVVASIHGEVTRLTWDRIQEWEQLHAGECDNVTLARFEGLSHLPSVKARMLQMLGHPAPFDRHDWFVDRCGREVRYVIDYYAPWGSHGFHIDVRPAPTLSGVLDRAHMMARHWFPNVFGKVPHVESQASFVESLHQTPDAFAGQRHGE
ncbi:MAG: hypothetical protein MHM6MM_002319 [Cercozoa sp. M6MM]